MGDEKMIRKVKVSIRNGKYDFSLPAIKIKSLKKLVVFASKLCEFDDEEDYNTIDMLMFVNEFLDEVIDNLNMIEPLTLLEAVDKDAAVTVELK